MSANNRHKDLFESLYPIKQRYVFVFKQGFKKTNVHAVEFIYLLQMHTVLGKSGKSKHLQVVSTNDILESADQYLPIIRGARDDDERAKTLESFVAFFGNKAVVDFNMTTATVFLPDEAAVDFAAIVAESGYVHSFGNYIIVDDLQNLTEIRLTNALEYAVKLSTDEGYKTLLVPYCHEDFTSRDRTKSMFLADGLDDIKFYISKAFVGQKRLYHLLKEFVSSKIEEVVLAPTDYRKSKEEFSAKFPNHEPSTVWLVTDFGLRDDELSASKVKYFLAYRQIFKNENFYHFYEENKPAWASHTTLPHSLAGAMLNLARRWLPDGEVRICDPFSGSGTVFLEAQKFIGLRCNSYDLSHLNIEVMSDNIRFFQQNAEQLAQVITDLSSFETANPANPLARAASTDSKLGEIFGVVKEWRAAVGGDDFLNLDEDVVQRGLSRVGDSLDSRIALYCALRAAVRGSVDLDRDISSWDEVFKREIVNLKNQIANHLDELKQMGGHIQQDAVTIGSGSYSQQILPPSPSNKSLDLFSLKEFNVADVANLPAGLYDAIICDPPYGFNTDEDSVEIIKFAELLVMKLVESLKKTGGQIIMTLPQVSYTGRGIPLSLRGDQVARRLIDYCLKTDRLCWKPALVLPCPLTNYIAPPYYWRSEKALERRVLHFWIYPKLGIGQ